MKQELLTEYLEGKSQPEVANQLGLTQTAISKMLRTGRQIYLTVDPAGSVRDAWEVKRIGKFRDIAA